MTLLSAGHSFLTYEPVTSVETELNPGSANGSTVAPDDSMQETSADPLVVATIDGVGPGLMVAFDANGSVAYYNESWLLYHDVDPSTAGKHTVTYVASGHADASTCPGEKCLRNAIERVNLTTGNVTRLLAWSDVSNGSTQTHDVDRINESVFLVADISYPDRVYMVNITTGEVIWEWRVSEAYEPESGGSYPSDWTHMNDIEYLPDGRVMANLRNQDQIVFIEPGSGLQDKWTLGADDDHDILYEAHNPDYIPEDRGGPAVVVADSENNRLVEYQRVNGEWERTWHWQDASMQWPRDADRLPSGRTLVADTHGQRILSVRPNGTIAWSRQFPTGGYDVEILGTGDESSGGESAERLGLASRSPTTPLSDGNTSMRASTVGPGVTDSGMNPNTSAANVSGSGNATGQEGGPGASLTVIIYGVTSLVPPLILHGLLYTLPPWVRPVDAALLLATGLAGTIWIATALGTRLLRYLRSVREN